MAADDHDVVYVCIRNIPSSFHSSDLRNHFSEFVETSGFACFHFKHRPQVLLTPAPDVTECSNNASILPNRKLCKERFCCVAKVYHKRFEDLLKRYRGTHWCNRNGETIPLKCIIDKIKIRNVNIPSSPTFKTRSELHMIPPDRVEFSFDDLKNFKELHPPAAMPNGNVGTPTKVFLNLIRACVLPASVIGKLGLEFPRSRAKRMYGSVYLDYGTDCVVSKSDDDDDIVYTRNGQILSKSEKVTSSPGSISNKASDDISEERTSESESEDNDRCEEWERHESLHNDVTQQDRSKERLFEEEIELKWEKGGSGLVFYTDAQYWDELEGDFDAKTADDWDVDMSIYYEPGAGDMDARDMLLMRKEKQLREGSISHSKSVEFAGSSDEPFRNPNPHTLYKKRRKENDNLNGDAQTVYRIGSFEDHTKGIGKRILKMQGWHEGQGIGKSVEGISEPIEDFGQRPWDKKGFGFRGEKLNRHPFSAGSKKRKDIHISSVYSNPKLSDPYVPINRSDFFTRLSYRQSFLKTKNL